ncbi:unnamed protein product [Blepharisma stoltei]|uniref:DNA replication licensing factor MCM5 n=1 Tax=Blepharisma stoltei TaxID=1481888 RepID=A0AAU9KH34_9CILI|nr:unnamed protein product [Blepharisma stoltei]
MAQTAFDGQEIYFSDQNLGNEDLNQHRIQLDAAARTFKLFLRDWTKGNSYVYREQLVKNAARGEFYIEVDLEDIAAFDEGLCEQIIKNPTAMLPELDKSATEVYRGLLARDYEPPTFQVMFISNQRPKMLRDLSSDLMGKLVVIPGIVVAATKPIVKATKVKAQCSKCGDAKEFEVPAGFSKFSLPRVCGNINRPAGEKCPLDSYVILSHECSFIDLQTIKVQERPEDVPTGEMPRTVSASVERYLVDKISPGSRITLIAIFSVNDRGSSILKNSYLRGIGIIVDNTEHARFRNFYSVDDEELFHTMSRDPEIYNKIWKSIAPAVFGNEDIKKAIACLLFGGSRKTLPEGVRLRGDINVLLIGDPSTAKSQFLKFVSRVAPIAVYTSGKGSSASGLTASVIKDASSGEFQLEGGAMVLADGGVVCIDEFDKMRPDDRVAIHEAMEQQTISIAKAGITTILNSRTSVLAAANPIYGSYDDLKQAQEQIELQSTILSRFDCIFLVRDLRNEAHDREMAAHVVNLHMGNTMHLEETSDIEINELKKYIAYARSKCVPRLHEDSAKLLQNFYVSDRKKQANGAFPVTVRQLEAIIRLSESIAKMSLSTVVTTNHVEEAHRLFEVSTMNAASAGLSAAGISVPREMAELVMKIEEATRRRVAIGTKITKARLEQELLTMFTDYRAVEMALVNMIKREEFQQRDGWKMLQRTR